MKKVKYLVLILLAIGMCTGCSKCVESHKEDGVCHGCRYYRIGRVWQCFPYSYNCKITICDKWEVNK